MNKRLHVMLCSTRFRLNTWINWYRYGGGQLCADEGVCEDAFSNCLLLLKECS